MQDDNVRQCSGQMGASWGSSGTRHRDFIIGNVRRHGVWPQKELFADDDEIWKMQLCPCGMMKRLSTVRLSGTHCSKKSMQNMTGTRSHHDGIGEPLSPMTNPRRHLDEQPSANVSRRSPTATKGGRLERPGPGTGASRCPEGAFSYPEEERKGGERQEK